MQVVKKINRLQASPDGSYTERRLRVLLKDIDDFLKELYAQAGDKLKRNMTDFAAYEVDFTKRMMEKGITVADFATPDLKQLEQAIFGSLMDVSPGAKGPTFGNAISNFSKKKRQEIIRIIRQGAGLGESTSQMVQEISRIMRGKQQRQAEALVRTITNHVATTAREALYKANRDVIAQEQWVSTLDGRTSHICRSLDGERFPVGKGIHPPAHYNCRSVRIPVVKDEYNVLTDLPSKRSARNPKTGKSELVDGRTNYNSWLKKQTKGFQEEVLGKTRAKLFRDGGLSMERFVDKNYNEINLDKLKQLEPMAFEKAGLA